MFLEISQNSQESTSARVSFLKKLQGSGLGFLEQTHLLVGHFFVDGRSKNVLTQWSVFRGSHQRCSVKKAVNQIVSLKLKSPHKTYMALRDLMMVWY